MYKKKNLYIHIYILYIHDRLRRESLNEIGRASGPQATKRERKEKRKTRRTEKSEQSILWLRTLVSVALASLSDTSGEIHARTTTVEEYLGRKNERKKKKTDSKRDRGRLNRGTKNKVAYNKETRRGANLRFLPYECCYSSSLARKSSRQWKGGRWIRSR